MLITFIGVGSAFTTEKYYHANMVVTADSGKRLLIDCGSDARFALKESNICPHDICNSLDAVYISHLHADHVGGLEWLAIATYFGGRRRQMRLFGEKKLLADLWKCSLKGGLSFIQERKMSLNDYFVPVPLQRRGSFAWEGLKFSLVPMPHILCAKSTVFSYGLFIEVIGSPERSVFITTDTQFRPDILAPLEKKAALIFHDCETSKARSTVHAHYEELLTLPLSLRRKMWLYHYQPNPDYAPRKDGFLGFIQKGQQFSI